MIQKGQTGILVLVGVLVIAVVAGGAYYLGKSSTSKFSPSSVITSQTSQPTLSPDASSIIIYGFPLSRE